MSLWTGIIDPQRATDWSTVGASSNSDSTTLPSASWANCVTAACNLIWNGGAAGAPITQANVDAAISGAPNDSVVRLPPGTYTGLTGFTFARNRVALRGQGASSTKLVFTSGAAGQCGWQQSGAMKICAGTSNIGCAPGCGGTGADNTATWSGGLAQNSTTITISSNANLVARSGSVPGTLLFLDQINDASDGFPATGDLFFCESTNNGCSWEGNPNAHRGGRTQVELHEVVSFSGTAPNIQVVIDPPIHAPNFRAGQTPQAWWASPANIVKQVGVENVTIDFTAMGSHSDAIYAVNTSNCWASGNRYIWAGGDAAFLFHVYLLNTFRFTQRDSYTYGPTRVNRDPITNYVMSPLVSGSLLIENNIVHHYA